MKRVPVLVLTGFLGSGKTTLLNRMMRARPDTRRRLAVVVNELGAVGIDGELLGADKTRQIELPGGCICCVLNDDLDRTLDDLLAGAGDLELIIIETTGVAEPLPIAWTLDREPLAERVRLAAVITVVDVTLWERSRALSVAVDAQVEYADILVLGKLDLVASGVPPDTLIAALDALNPTAPRVMGAPDGIVDELWKTVLDPSLPEIPQKTTEPEDWPRSLASAMSRAPRRDPDKSDPHAAHLHPRGATHGIASIALPVPAETIDFEELTSQLEELPGSYVRIKGILLAIDESTGSREPRWIAFHRVGTRVSCEPVAGPATPRVVALGHDLDVDRLAACFTASVVRSG